MLGLDEITYLYSIFWEMNFEVEIEDMWFKDSMPVGQRVVTDFQSLTNVPEYFFQDRISIFRIGILEQYVVIYLKLQF